MNEFEARTNDSNVPELVAFEKFLAELGRSRTTGWRWRKLGWLETLEIAGRHYITAQAVEKFIARAATGEFSKKIQGDIK